MEVILLERVAKLGQMGETVKVRSGYARNFLLPRGKALRATEANKKHFDAQRAQLEARNLERRKEAGSRRREAERPELHHPAPVGRDGRALRFGLHPRPRRGHDPDGFTVDRNQIVINPPIKTIGLHVVPVSLHPEVEVTVTTNIARSPEEAERQARGEAVTTREETNLDDLGLEVGAALAEAGDVEL